MPSVAVLDANAFINLEGRDVPNPSLAEISQLSRDAQIKLYITPELIPELKRDPNVKRKKRQMAHAEKFPKIAIMDMRRVENLSNELSKIIFPNVTSKRQVNNRISDCRQLAYAIEFEAEYFVTADVEILRKQAFLKEHFSIEIVHPDKLLTSLKSGTITGLRDLALVHPKLNIRKASKSEKNKISELLRVLDVDYPGFKEKWLPKQFETGSGSVIKVVLSNDNIAGVSISKDKGDGVVKLSTFFVREDDKRKGLGHHLLQNEIINWARNKFRKAIVTVPLHKKDLICFFGNRGFYIDGVSPKRYDRDPEVIMSRFFLNRIIKSNEWEAFVSEFLKDFLVYDKIEEKDNILWIPALSHGDWIIPIKNNPLHLESYFGEPSAYIRLHDISSNVIIREWDTYRLETDLFPILLSWPKRTAALIPIKREFADLLFEYHAPTGQEKLIESVESVRLRADNVYYRSPTGHGNIKRGSHILFYVSDPEKGVVAVARVKSVEEGQYEKIYETYEHIGVFKSQDVKASSNRQGKVQAICFDYLESFSVPVSLDSLRKLIPSLNLQTTYPVPFDIYCQIRSLGEI